MMTDVIVSNVRDRWARWEKERVTLRSSFKVVVYVNVRGCAIAKPMKRKN
jgi:hypothetical protein